ncbi:MAG: hypothetical protein K9N55_18885 [Phycisphaerae bacterium]|nr:hypothetical protein [Phycisphaerae bacterium]
MNPMSTEGTVEALQGLDKTPHGESDRCDVCHMSAEGESSALLFDGDVMALCQSCHDGKKASQEVHPVAVPVTSMAAHWPSDFPLKEGHMTCLTCHDMARACQGEAAAPAYLRGQVGRHRVEFCARCHDTEQAKRFNVHDQKEADSFKTETCLWCHVGPWDSETPGYENPVYPLRPYGSGLCENCHAVASDHPSGGPHMNALPSEEMMWYMAANELRERMRLPFKDLLSFVKAAKRSPRALPLNSQSRITCYTCHNPHETGVIRASSPRALGAEGKQARNYRLRAAKKGQMCQACHNK